MFSEEVKTFSMIQDCTKCVLVGNTECKQLYFCLQRNSTGCLFLPFFTMIKIMVIKELLFLQAHLQQHSCLHLIHTYHYFSCV